MIRRLISVRMTSPARLSFPAGSRQSLHFNKYIYIYIYKEPIKRSSKIKITQTLTSTLNRKALSPKPHMRSGIRGNGDTETGATPLANAKHRSVDGLLHEILFVLFTRITRLHNNDNRNREANRTTPRECAAAAHTRWPVPR